MENQENHSENTSDMPSREVLLAQAREVKQSSGVYLMKDAQGGVLYVGKAKNLPNRISSYFQVIPHEIPRIELMVSRVHHFDVILTETESEALVLESTLIKKYKPKFNVRLKDDKGYPYIRIQEGDDFPRLEWMRRIHEDGARYFGPFPSAWAAKQVLEMLVETFQLRNCSDNTFRHRSRPCILYQMGKCSAPCVGKVPQKEYHQTIQSVVRVLEGHSSKLLNTLKASMAQAAEDEEYELAAQIRDQIKNLEIVTETQAALEAGVNRDRDVLGVARIESLASLAQGTILSIRGGRLISVRHYQLQNVDSGVLDSELFHEFLAQHYLIEKHEIPKEVLLPLVPEDALLLEQTLGVRILIPAAQQGDAKAMQLLKVAHSNAEYALEQAIKKVEREQSQGHGSAALDEVMEKLHLERLPYRIECYDVSNIQGEAAVASRVVFINGAPEKKFYRHYKIRTVQGANDFAMMKEVLGRRFSHAEEELPDLVLVDGGKGQLAQAVAILEELNVQGVPVAGLAKARTESDFKATEVKMSSERVFLPNRKNPVVLLPHTRGFKLLTHLRDEAHRFAITYHRKLMEKRVMGESAE